MRRTISIFAVVFLITAASVHGAPIVLVEASPAVNIFGSPSWVNWSNNALQALGTNSSTAGTPNTPAYYVATMQVTSAELIVSSFPSWRAKANPGAVFGSAFASELGNRLTYSYFIYDSSGADVDIANGITLDRPASPWRAASSSAVSSFYYPIDTSGNSARIGIEYGANGVFGGGDDTYVTSGTGLVDAIFATGPGLGDAECGAGTQQAQLDCARASIDALGAFSETYKVTYGTAPAYRGASASGTATVEVNSIAAAVPEPTSITLVGVAVAGIIGVRRRRR
jgi:hypothetical protein